MQCSAGADTHRVYAESHRGHSETHRVYEERHRGHSKSHRVRTESHQVCTESHRACTESHQVCMESSGAHGKSSRAQQKSSCVRGESSRARGESSGSRRRPKSAHAVIPSRRSRKFSAELGVRSEVEVTKSTSHHLPTASIRHFHRPDPMLAPRSGGAPVPCGMKTLRPPANHSRSYGGGTGCLAFPKRYLVIT